MNKLVILAALFVGSALRVAPVYTNTFTAVGIKYASPDSYHFALGGGTDPWSAVLGVIGTNPFIPVVIFLLTVPAVYLLAWMLFNSKVAALAVLAFAVLPGEYLGRSVLGELDRHVFEVFILAWLVVILLALFKYTFKHIGFYLAAAGIAFCVYQFAPWVDIKQYLGFMSSGYSNLTSEARNIFTPPAIIQIFNVGVTITLLYLLYRHAKRYNQILVAFTVWTLIILGLTVWQRRFDYLLILNLAVLVGWGLNYLCDKNDIPSWVPAVALVLAAGVFSFKFVQASDYRPSDEWVTNLEYLNSQPAGAVLTWWDYGNWVRYYTGLQPSIDPGQDVEAIKQAAKYFVYGVKVYIPDKYVIVDEAMVTKFLPAILTWAGEKSTDYVYPMMADRLVFTKKYNSLFLVRLYYNEMEDYEYLVGDKVKVYKYVGGE